jgi:hypothetical protein
MMAITHGQKWDSMQMENFEMLCKVDKSMSYTMLLAVISF